MYTEKKNQLLNENEIHDFIRDNSFATLVSNNSGKLWASHLPLLLHKSNNSKYLLQGCLDRANIQWRYFTTMEEVLAIFQSTPTFNIATTHKPTPDKLPTWQHRVVQVYGIAEIIDKHALSKHMVDLQQHYRRLKAPNKTTAPSLPLSEAMVNNYVGFNIHITKIEASFVDNNTIPEQDAIA